VDSLICRLRKGLKLTAFMVTHDIDTLRAAADRIAVLVDRKLKIGTIEPYAPTRIPGSMNTSTVRAPARP